MSGLVFVRSAVLAGGLSVASLAMAQSFTVTSPDIKPQATIAEEQVFNGFGCSGKNVSPALAWSGAPTGTKSFAVLVHDPDAPTGGAGWWHWVVVNIPASVTTLKKGAGKADGAGLPQGAVQVATDFGSPGWGGPCPPAGDKPHRYRISVYALKVEKLDLPKGATASLVGFMVNANSLGRATLVGRYGRAQ